MWSISSLSSYNFLIQFYIILSCATINCFTLQSYEKQIWHCRFLSEFVRICQFLSVFGTMLSLAAKLRKRKLALSVYVSLCQSMSLYVTFRFIASFSMQSYEKEIWHCHLLSLFVTFQQIAFSRCKVTEKKFGTVRICPHMSAYVRKCPLLSAFLFRCKVTKSKFGNVQICPIMSKFVHLILRRFHFLPKLFGICLENAYLCTQEDKQDNYENKVFSSPFGSIFEPQSLLAGSR